MLEQAHRNGSSNSSNERIEADPAVDHETEDDIQLQVEEETSTENLESSDDIYPVKMKRKESMLDEDEIDGFWARQFKRMARNPWIHLNVTLVVSSILSVVALTVGNFEPTVDNAGWQSRGTLIADRQSQTMLVEFYNEYLFYGGAEAWNDLLENVQQGWETDAIGSQTDEDRRRLISPFGTFESSGNKRTVPFLFDSRLLQTSQYLEGCDLSWYTNWTALEVETHLWPVWQAQTKTDSFLDPALIHDLCVAESTTQSVLESKGLCFGCETGCLPPYSVVLYARLIVPDGFSLSCKELSDQWPEYQLQTEGEWSRCVADLKAVYDPTGSYVFPESCPLGFSPTLMQENFDETVLISYTSSIFATSDENVDDLYSTIESFDRGSNNIVGAYDTQYEDFNMIFTDSSVGRDMALAMGSAAITTLAMVVHTRSLFITFIGLIQVILSFPLSYFVYTFLCQLDFFPFLNFIGVFVLFALGADNVFVATDKWKNARISHPSASNLAIAAIALPDAAGSMFLTSFTTAIAFFSTAICPVAPIKLFAVFCGLLISFGYILCILLVFPALCIYDRKVQSGTRACWMHCHGCQKMEGSNDDEDDEEGQSLIRRILMKFYNLLHRIRWGLFIVCLIGLGICIYVSSTLELPTSADVRILDKENEYELNYAWRKHLLYDVLNKAGGSKVTVGFGLTPADTGDLNNPKKWSQLVLDKSFDPSSEAAQTFLLSFCPNLFEEEFAELPVEGYQCPLDAFAAWVEEQATADTPDAAYVEHCAGAESLPMPPQVFQDCVIAWSVQVEDTRVLSNEGKVLIIWFQFASRVRWDSPFDDLDNEWNRIENWFDAKSTVAPAGVENAVFSSADFWWYDTNGQMLSTAYGAAGLALGGAAAVILLSSRSFTLTVFAVVTIGYVLTAVTATLVGLGWTLGFLESICFAILIGVSVDFVIHFTHSYSHYKGKHSRHERTKHALIQMGPSILAAGFTTISAAIVMLFTVITFFQKFALILLLTILQATIGAFIVFLTMADCIGPSDPTALMDRLLNWCKRKYQSKDSEPAKSSNDETQTTSKLQSSFAE